MERRQIEGFIYSRLPEKLKSLTDDFEDREKDIVLLSSLGVLSDCLPNIYGVYDGNKISSNLYVMIIAPPASGKGVMNYARALIEPIHDKIYQDSKNEYLICEGENKGKKNDREDCPDIMVKILPANISTSEMYSYMGSSNHGLLIMESEADTYTQLELYSAALQQQFGELPDNACVYLIDRKGNAFKGEQLTLGDKFITIARDINQNRIDFVLNDIQKTAEEISKYYQIFVKLNKLT